LRPKPVEVIKVVEKTIEKEVNPGRFVAVLQPNPDQPAFILTVDVANRTASVRRVAGGPPPGKSYELWLVSDRFPAPRSLGLVSDEFARPAALANYDQTVISNATYAVSLEPEGGSPTGAPTGPVLFTAKLVDAVPPSP
jgi:anti-sigma-K factor RskA